MFWGHSVQGHSVSSGIRVNVAAVGGGEPSVMSLAAASERLRILLVGKQSKPPAPRIQPPKPREVPRLLSSASGNMMKRRSPRNNFPMRMPTAKGVPRIESLRGEALRETGVLPHPTSQSDLISEPDVPFPEVSTLASFSSSNSIADLRTLDTARPVVREFSDSEDQKWSISTRKCVDACPPPPPPPATATWQSTGSGRLYPPPPPRTTLPASRRHRGTVAGCHRGVDQRQDGGRGCSLKTLPMHHLGAEHRVEGGGKPEKWGSFAEGGRGGGGCHQR